MLKCFGIAIIFTLGLGSAHAQTVAWDQLMQEGRAGEAYSAALKQLQGAKADFYWGVLAFQAGKHDEALKHLTSALSKNEDVGDYAVLFRGQTYLAKGDLQKALEDFKAAQSTSRIKFVGEVAQFFEAEVYLALKQWKKAEPLYQKALKKLSRTKYHPSILWGSMVTEIKTDKMRKVCRNAKELYLKYPAFEKVSDWGIFLHDNTAAGKKLNCIATFPEQKLRLQRMLWAGLEDQAHEEIKSLKKKAAGSQKYEVDELYVTYLLHEGHVDEALKVLMGYDKEKAGNYEHLMLLGKVYGRSNTPEKGVEAYYRAYQISPRANHASPALFQSAFLSYLSHDYAGALQKFKEYSAKYATNRTNADSLWYQAWIQYLQKNFSEAEKGFTAILEAKKKKPRYWTEHKEDKINYWIAMSLLRQEKKNEAAELFAQMTHDDSVGYYSVAAFQRLNQLSDRKMSSLALKTAVHENWWLPQAVASAAKKDFEDDNIRQQTDPFETKVNAILTFEDQAEAALSDELVIKRIPQNLEKDVKSVYFNNIEKTMYRAHTLSRLGLDELAYREVLDTENQKLTNQQKQWLLQAHSSVNSFNRTVVLASYFFSDQAAKFGLHHGTDYWMFSYPRAYENLVMKDIKKLEIPAELVWSIMRAETIFRPDAISPVGARGLMQVMPRTGRKLAGLMGETFETADELLKPPVSIKFGSYYLNRLNKKFKGNIALVAAAYNGGPHRVHAWMHYFGGLELDEFIEHIPYLETRNYVKKVTKYYAIYNLLYKKKTDALEALAKPIGFQLEGTVPTMETWERI